MRRAWLSGAMLVAGTSLLVSAGHAGDAKRVKFRQGGTLRVYMPGTDAYHIDPSLAYGHATWHIEQSTALNLLSYPDAPAPRGSRLVPEGASSYRVSRNGTTYTFTIRKGFRFSDGAPVTARNYAHAFNRALNARLGSPARWFFPETDGRAVSVEARGDKVIFELPRPDGGLPAKLAMPFFQAISLRLPLGRVVDTVDSGNPLPSAGPYYVSYWESNRRVTLKRNPYYGGKRKHRLTRIEIKVESDQQAYEDVRANRADFTYELPSNVPGEVAREFGLRGRFRLRPSSCLQYIVMNTSNPLFRDNPQLRRAVNYVIDRRALAGSAAATYIPTDQYLPIGLPGFDDIDAYPFTPDIEKARRLAAGHVPSGGPWLYYHVARGRGYERMRMVRDSLRSIGIEIQPVGFRNFEPWELESAAGRRNSRHAFASIERCGDVSLGRRYLRPQPTDPYDFINPHFDGTNTLKDEDNTNIAYFNDPTYNRRLARASRLTGTARNRAYAALEHDLVTKAAPWAAWGVASRQFFFSKSVDMRSFVYQPIDEAPPYNLLALK